MELQRLNSEPCACLSGFISPGPPLPQLLLKALEHSVCVWPGATSGSRRSRRSLVATSLRLTVSVPSLGLWRKRVPCCGQPSWEKWIRVSLLPQSAVSFTGTGWDSHLTQLRLALSNSTLGVGVASVSITPLGENEARGLRSIRAGLEGPMCHFPVKSFCQSPAR